MKRIWHGPKDVERAREQAKSIHPASVGLPDGLRAVGLGDYLPGELCPVVDLEEWKAKRG